MSGEIFVHRIEIPSQNLSAIIDNLALFEGFHVGRRVARGRSMIEDASLHEDLTERIIGCAMTVHDTLGPGLLESIYQRCLVVELRASSLQVATERYAPVLYRGTAVDSPFRLDIVVEELVIVEVKAVQSLAPVHHAQVISYLKLTGCPVGLLINFNVTLLKHGIRKVVRPDLYRKPSPVSPVSPVDLLERSQRDSGCR
jgi:GxxExxY protein